MVEELGALVAVGAELLHVGQVVLGRRRGHGLQALPTGGHLRLDPFERDLEAAQLLVDEVLGLMAHLPGPGLGLLDDLAAPLLGTYLATGLVPRFPTAILATGLGLLSALSLTAGLVLDTVTRGRHEKKMLAYLAIRGP